MARSLPETRSACSCPELLGDRGGLRQLALGQLARLGFGGVADGVDLRIAPGIPGLRQLRLQLLDLLAGAGERGGVAGSLRAASSVRRSALPRRAPASLSRSEGEYGTGGRPGASTAGRPLPASAS